MAPKSRLQRIADEMVKQVRDAKLSKAWVSHTLPGGLDLIYSKAEEQRRLALRRIGVQPSDHEIDICGDVFGVPDETYPHRYTRKDPAGTYHVAELVWREYA
jgi:hypothetical protein